MISIAFDVLYTLVLITVFLKDFNFILEISILCCGFDCSSECTTCTLHVFYKKNFYNKMSFKNPTTIRQCLKNLQPQMPEQQFFVCFFSLNVSFFFSFFSDVCFFAFVSIIKKMTLIVIVKI